MTEKAGAGGGTGSGNPGCCPFFWASQNPGSEMPAYLSRYPQRFICRGGRHSSLLTYDELIACIEGNGDRCPNAGATA